MLGPLISSSLEHGDGLAYFKQAAGRLHHRPDGPFVKLSVRTIEGWYYAGRHGGFEALYPKGRSDSGLCRAIAPELAEPIVKTRPERPRRAIRRIIRMLGACVVAEPAATQPKDQDDVGAKAAACRALAASCPYLPPYPLRRLGVIT